MKNRIKIEKEATEYRQRIVSINGISDFWEHPRYENCWIYNGRNPTVNCCVTVVDDYVEINGVNQELSFTTSLWYKFNSFSTEGEPVITGGTWNNKWLAEALD